MQVKKYRAETLQEALNQVKNELGTKATILKTQKVKSGSAFGLFGKEMVEVVASDQILPKTPSPAQPGEARKPTAPNPYPKTPETEEPFSGSAKDPVKETERLMAPLRNEILEMKDSLREIHEHGRQEENNLAHLKNFRHDLNEMKSILFSFMDQGKEWHLKNLHRNLAVLYKQLVANGMEERFALKLVEESQKKISKKNVDNPSYVRLYLARMLMQVIRTADVSPGGEMPLMLSFVGSTGVGKTTTLAKIASHARMENPDLEVGLITLDTFRLGAVEQLKEYARKIKVKFRVAQNARELNRTLREFNSMDAVLIDTPGASQRDSSKISALEEALANKPFLKNCLILPANMKDGEMVEVTKRYASLNLHSVIFTKLDETTTFGNVFNHSIRFKLPVSYLTFGQRVPEDFENASKERLIDLLMNISGELEEEKSAPLASEKRPNASFEACA